MELDLATVALLVAVTFLTAALSAITGFGGAILLLPVFAATFGARDAVAILTITQLASNGSRVAFNRHEIDRPLLGVFALGAVPAASAGAFLLSTAPLPLLTRGIGGFLIAAVVWLRRRPQAMRIGDRGFVVIGVVSGFCSALFGSVGVLVAPFFLARGLVRGAYIGTEAASALVMHVTKLVVFGAAAVLSVTTLGYGLALTPASIAGSYVGKRTIERLPISVFTTLVQIGLVIAGVLLIVLG